MNSNYDRFFNIPLGPDFADYLLNLSRGLAGDLVKRICFCLGDTNTGKSTLVKACTNAFGKFVGTVNAKNFALKSTVSLEGNAIK